MTLEASIQNLADAINRLADAAGREASYNADDAARTAMQAARDAAAPAEPTPAKRGPGRPRKDPDAIPPRAEVAAKAAETIESDVEAPTREAVRAVCIEVVKRLGKDALTGVLAGYDATKQTDVPDERLADFMADLKTLFTAQEPA